MDFQPTYKKFAAKTPQFSQVGKAMYDHWFGEHKLGIRMEFTFSDLSYLLEWMWHEIEGWKAVINDRDMKIKELIEEIKDLKEEKSR